MKKQFCGQLALGLLVVIVLLVWSAAPGYAMSRGGFVGGGFHGSFHHPSNHVFFSSRGFVHHRCCFGPRFFFGVGVAAPFFYPYAYPYPYPVYAPPAVVESPPVYVQQGPQAQYQQQYWYYCQSSQTYYPYVKECPGGWLQVVPQSSPPPQ